MSNIVLIDDDESIVFMLKENLLAEGHSVREGYDGQTAMNLVKDQIPDLLIMDFNLPGISGKQALELLRANPVTQNLPVLFLTGEPPEKILPKGGLLRTRCLTKPVDLSTLNALVGEMIGRR